ncbi:hypothetical protein TCDM_12848 [Trypanosoma cruzi Dm28c]|uniref:Uncharacterized protein n=1 Tax=Trypanosoma cruzi Dm28c TaxID=1416333 RepID=V5APV6_TRYCR|nr:hypothetical protein TCDM_12848 [Trypanosoma cruzi Dm28c]
MRRGQQAQPHSSHTTKRHPRKEGKQRQQPHTMQEEKTSTTISPSSFPQPQGNGKSPRPPHNAHGASTHHTSHTRRWTLIHPSRGKKNSSHPALNGMRRPTQRSHTRCSTPAGKETRAAHSLSSLLLMATKKDNSRHTQLPACTAKGAFKSTAMCILCVWLCVPAATQSKQVEKRKQSMWRDAKKCTAETHGGNNKKKTAQTHDCTAVQAAAIHTIFIENKKRPLRLTQTPSHKIIINKKKSSITVPNKF